ncbi:MAG: hydrogenase [Hydrogenimonas sp.]|nr:MAG: hydrogenase [Hydrogenimonas sp.]
MMTKPKVIWLQGASCNGNSHAFFNYPYLKTLLQAFDFLYHPLLPSPLPLASIVNDYSITCDILIFEGSVDAKFNRAGLSSDTLLQRFDGRAKTIIAAGTCASFGGIFSENDQNTSGILYRHEQPLNKPLISQSDVINLPGCPVHPHNLATILLALKANQPIPLDTMHRPKEIYAHTVHQGCSRSEYFEWKVDAKSFGHKEGCLFYEQGCRAPMTHGNCNLVLWNEVNSKPRAGIPCFGCTDPKFPNFSFFHTPKNMSIPAEIPLDVSKRAYLTISGIAKTFSIPRLKKRLLDD